MQMSRQIVVVGAGDFGREVCEWAGADVIGFIDDNIEISGLSLPILSTIYDYVPQQGQVLVMGIADPLKKLQVARSLREKGAEFISVIHPTAVIARDARISQGSVLCPNVVVSSRAEIGNFVSVNIASSIGHDSKIGDGCTISCHCDVTGYVALGESVFMGSHAVVLPKVHVGAGAKIGAGSVAVRDVPPGVSVFGVPAKKI